MGLDQVQVKKLLARLRREVDDGLLPSCQVALGYGGEVVVNEVFGDADLDTRYCLFSATKALVAAAMWQLITEGGVDVDERVEAYVPEFATNQKNVVTVEQVMLHTSGFPAAPLGPDTWTTGSSRSDAMSQWHLNWEPGTRYEYHPTSAHWVLAAIIESVTGDDFRDEIHHRVTEPLGLPRLLGIPADQQSDIADLSLRGERATADELEAVFGVRALPATEVTDEFLLRFNEPAVREVGVPGAGGYARASDVATFYQGLIRNPNQIWESGLLADVTGRVRNTMSAPDGVPANRSLGLLVAGDDGMANRRGFGRTVSPRAFGHNGAGGQLAWADPTTGLSLGYVTSGYDRHEIREPRRGTAISSLAALCTTS